MTVPTYAHRLLSKWAFMFFILLLPIAAHAASAPSMSAISNQTVTVNSSTAPLPFTVSDANSDLNAITVDGFSSNQVLIPNYNIVFTGAGSERTVRIKLAPNQSGTATIRLIASDGGFSDQITFTVTVLKPNVPPTVSIPASASPNPISGTTATLQVLGGYSGGESDLTYTWSTVGTAPAPVTFGLNGTNASKSTTATFLKTGTYRFLCTISNSMGFSLDETLVVAVAATASAVTIEPAIAYVPKTSSLQFSAFVVDQFGDAISNACNWSVSGGVTISETGSLTGTVVGGPNLVSANIGGTVGFAYVSVSDPGNAAPVIVSPAHASANPLSGTTCSLDVVASDDAGEKNLSYSWSSVGTSPAPVNFSLVGTNSAKSVTASFSKAGTYELQCLISDQGGMSALSTVVLNVASTPNRIAVSPSDVNIRAGASKQYSAQTLDQFGSLIGPTTPVAWSVNKGGTISTTGLFTAGLSPMTITVSARSGSLLGSAYAFLASSVNAPAAAPINVAVTPAPGSLAFTSAHITWSVGDTSPVSSFMIFRDGVAIDSTAAVGFDDNALLPGRSYIYAIVTNRQGASDPSPSSNPVTYTVPAESIPPSAPIGLMSVGHDDGSVTLAWQASTDYGGSGIRGYRILRNGILIGESSAESFVDVGIASSTRYFYQVFAVDLAGNSSAGSSVLDALSGVEEGAPNAPASLTASAKTETSITIGWTAANDASGILGYEILRQGNKVGQSDQTTFTDFGLTPGTSYSYSVRAIDGVGNRSTTSATLSAITLADSILPSTPAGLVASLVNDSSVTLNWSTSTDNIGLAGYDVYRGASKIGSSPTTSFTDQSVLGNTPYSFTVRARDLAGNLSPASVSLTVMTTLDTTSPSTPAALCATPSANKPLTSVFLNWPASTDNIGVVGYDVFLNGDFDTTVNTTSFTDTGLSPGATLRYQIKAFDAAGNRSEFSMAATLTLASEDQAPTSPTNLVVTSRTDAGVSVNWTAAADTGGSGVALYRILRDGSEVGTSQATSFSDFGLAQYTTYSYAVIAQDAAGNRSAPSVPVKTRILQDQTPPNVPAGLLIAAKSETTVSLAWVASTDNVGVERYEIYRGGTLVGLSDSATYTDVGLTPGTTYSYTFRASDTAGYRSSASSVLSVTTLADKLAPSVPTGLSSTAKTDNSVTLAWNAATDNTGIANYLIYRSSIQVGSAATTSFTVTGLNGSTSSTFTVKAKDLAGNLSGASASLTAVTLADTTAPSIPVTPNATSTFTAVTLSWLPSSDNVGVTAYEIIRDGTSIGTTATTSYTDSSRIPGGTYTYAIRSKDLAGNVSASSSARSISTKIDDLPPAPPTNLLIASKSASSAALSWVSGSDSGGSGIAGYLLLRNGIQIAAPTAMSFTDTGLASNTTYTYVVRSRDLSGNVSADSVPVFVSLNSDVTAPSVPNGLTTTAKTETSVSLAWNASADSVAVAGYEIFRGGTKVGFASSTSYTDSGLLPSQAYSYSARAVDTGGNRSVASTAVSVTTLADTIAPSAPTGMTASRQSESAIALNWSPATDNTGIAFYTVYQGSASIGNSNKNSFVVTGLNGNTAYSFTVKAVDLDNNVSPASAAFSVTTAPDLVPPAAPLSPNFSVAVTGVILNWLSVADNVGVTGYEIVRDGTVVATTASTSFTDSGRPAASTATYAIQARDFAGNRSPPSPAVIATTLADTQAPTSPANPVVGPRTDSSINVSWSAASDVGGSGIKQYRILRDGVEIATSTSTSFSDNGLPQSRTYLYAISAEDNAGNISASSFAVRGKSNQDQTPPSVPAGLALVEKSETAARIKWSASSDFAGVAGYEIYRSGTLVGFTADLAFTDNGLTPGISYSFTVRGFDEVGNRSNASAALSVAMLGDTVPPSVPAHLRATSVSVSTVGLEWDASSDNIGVASYVIFANNAQVGTTNKTTWTHTGLNSGTLFSYTVKAKDLKGNFSAATTALTVTTSPDHLAPSSPIGLEATAIGFSSITLRWLAASDDGLVDRYQLFRDGQSVAWITPSSGGTLYVDSGLKPGTTYTYSMLARDSGGNLSAPSATVSFATLSDTQPPTIPTNLSWTKRTDHSLTLTWKTATDPSGSGVVMYELAQDDIGVRTVPSAVLLIDDLEPDTTYTFAVRAFDAAGNASAWSLPLKIGTKPDETAPAAPTEVRSPQQTASTIRLRWDVSEDNAGVAGYEIFRDAIALGKTSDTEFTDQGLTSQYAYRYTIQAYDRNGNRSPMSKPLTVSTAGGIPSPLAEAPSFENERWWTDSQYRANYLGGLEPGRIWQTSDGKASTPMLSAVGSRRRIISRHDSSLLAVTGKSGSPVTFFCTGEGSFSENGKNVITVLADDSGQARATFVPSTTTKVPIIVGSPLAVGNVRFTIEVSP